MTDTEQSGAAPASAGQDYQKTIRVKATPDALFDAITTTDGLAAWWNRVTGSGDAGGELRFYMNAPEPLVIHVDEATRPRSVQWTVIDCPFLPDWVGTRPTFTITSVGGAESELGFRHHGLTAALPCFAMCRPSWDHFIANSLRELLESGQGQPAGSPADLAWRAEMQSAKKLVGEKRYLGSFAVCMTAHTSFRVLGEEQSMAKVIVGNHSSVIVPLRDRESIRKFYCDVLGGTLTRAQPERDFVRLGGDFYIAFLYGDVPDESEFLRTARAVWLELKSDNVEETSRKILESGVVRKLDIPDPHLYFQAPGGQCLRLVGRDEDLSFYEGTGEGSDAARMKEAVQQETMKG